MAKLQIKSGNVNPFGGLFSIFREFDRCGLRAVIDRELGKRGLTKAAFSHGDVFASLFANYLCGGEYIEDVMEIKPFWDGREGIRVCSSDVVLRTLRKLADVNVAYVSDKGKSYDFNANERMNSLLLKCLSATGQLCAGDCVDLDFDHQFIAADKKDASERSFDCQNNDFGWAHLPFSFLNENTVFLIATAMLKNFYLYLLDILAGRVKGIDRRARLKRFMRAFVIVPAKWTRSARRNVLTLYTWRRIYLELAD